MVITVTAVTIPQMYEETATLERTPCVLYSDVHAHLPRILHDEWLRATAVRKKCVNLQAC